MELSFHTITNGNKERIKSTTKALLKYNLHTKLHHFDKHPTNGRLGCFLSHIQLFKYAKKHCMEYICITEDNLTFVSHRISKYLLNHLYQFIESNSTWNIIILGGWYIPLTLVDKTSYKSIYNTKSIHGTSCYIIHKRLYTNILKCYKNFTDEHIDKYIMEMAYPESYILYPLLFRRNNIIPTSNTYFSNSIVNGYYYILCSKSTHKFMEYYATHYFHVWVLCFCIILLFIFAYVLH